MSLFRAGIPALLLGVSLVLGTPYAAQAVAAEPAAATVRAEKQPKGPTTEELTKDQSSYLALVSRDHPLDPADYKPKDLRVVTGSGHQLRADAATALESLLKTAGTQSHSLKVLSAYRSYSRQLSLFNGYKARYGTDYAMRLSAPAGTSEHQIGLAADIGLSSGSCDLKACFGETAGGKWLAANAADFGFIIRYPADGEEVTGYKYEPWHLRYIGVDQSKAMTAAKAGSFEVFHAALVKTSKVKPLTEAEIKKQRESLLVLRFLPPYRDWSIGYDFAR